MMKKYREWAAKPYTRGDMVTDKVGSDHYFDRRGYPVDLVLLGYDLLLV